MSPETAMRSLYLCYFSIHEPLVQTQVLPYLRQLRNGGVEVWLLTFEATWPNPPAPFPKGKGETAGSVAADSPLPFREGGSGGLGCLPLEPGIHWLSLPYHKRPTLPATLYDIAAGAVVAARLVRRHEIDVLHARSHVAAGMGALAKCMAGRRRDGPRSSVVGRRSSVVGRRSPRLIFDIRGLLAEEYVDAGVWPADGRLYRLTKRAERWLFDAADGFVVLTERVREILFPGCGDTDARGRPIAVIPCCVDPHRFEAADSISREAVRRELGVERRRVLVYVGALGGWYLTEEMADFLAAAHRQDPATFSLILTQSSPETIAEPLRARGVSPDDCRIERVSPGEIPVRLKAADLAISFIKPCYSKLSSSPTKIAEYLAAGLPVVSNTGIGDLDAILTEDRVGVLVPELNQAAYTRALAAAEVLRRDPNVAERCRAAARDRFSTEGVGGVRYRRLYERVVA